MKTRIMKTNPWSPAAICLSTGLSLLSMTGHAYASDSFPAALADAAGMICTPTCRACHAVDPGVVSTAYSQPFGGKLYNSGIAIGNPESVATAYEAIGAESDSDGDGETDYMELAADPPTDPNDPNLNSANPGNGLCSVEVLYGCGAHVASAPAEHSLGWLWAILSGLGIFTLFRRGARRSGD